ncbi:MAG: hypothetical protein CM15mV87_050 [Caudoviricetes sp.]|nr:MAG: hypothetical protein CM15mV87_050 [Caudoviricetes sp.]
MKNLKAGKVENLQNFKNKKILIRESKNIIELCKEL